MKYSIVTFGCRVNQADSLRIERDLCAGGAIPSSAADADVVVVNTCSVTATADQGARQTIRRIARDNPASRIVVTGCYASRCESDVRSLPNVVQVVPNELKDRLFEVIRGDGGAFEEHATLGDGPCGAQIQPGAGGRTTFTLRVQTGCNQPCAYCIIPSTRGSGRSLAIPDVVREVSIAAEAGFKEVVLTGVHLGSYGRDLEPRCQLVDLLRTLSELRNEVVFRISSLEPMDCSPELVRLVAESGGRFAPHFHLPLQHAGDRVLRWMRRPYSLSYYRDLVAAIHARLPHASIGSDLIVGFPGETEADFAANLEYLPASPLSHLHVFPYSDRPGTAASAMRDKVDGITIRRRGLQLREIGAALTRRFHDSQHGTVRPGLTLEDGTLVVTDNYLKVRIAAGLQRNQRVRVLVTAVNPALVGELVA